MHRFGSHTAKPLVALAVLVMVCAPARGSSVVPMTMAHMADRAAQAISGRVTAVRSYWAENPRRIESEVVFENVTYLKGAPDGAPTTYRLVVPGGKVGTMQMRLCCAPQFRVGDSWILLVLPEYKTFPVVGLYRGAFRATTDALGVDRVHTSDGQAVLGLNDAGQVQVKTGRFDPHEHLLGSMNAEVRTRERVARNTKAMSVAEFLSEIRPILNASRDHHLSAPAGRRIPVVFTPTALSIRNAAGGSPSASPSDSRFHRGRQAVNQRIGAPVRGSNKTGEHR